MTIVDSAGKPIGDLAPKTRHVTLDIEAIAQRAGIARGHPLDSQRTAAKNLLIQDVEDLLEAVRAMTKQYQWLGERHSKLVLSANNANVLLALILNEAPEWRWSKAAVEEFQPVGGWDLGQDPDDPDGWLLRMTAPDPTVSAEEQTDVSREADDGEPVSTPANFIGGAGLRVVGDQHDE